MKTPTFWGVWTLVVNTARGDVAAVLDESAWENWKISSNLGLDALCEAELFMMLEEAFGIEFNHEERNDLQDASIQELYEACLSKYESKEIEIH